MAGAGHGRDPGRLEVLQDVIQPFPTFSEIYVQALDELCGPLGACLTAAQSSG